MAQVVRRETLESPVRAKAQHPCACIFPLAHAHVDSCARPQSLNNSPHAPAVHCLPIAHTHACALISPVWQTPARCGHEIKLYIHTTDKQTDRQTHVHTCRIRQNNLQTYIDTYLHTTVKQTDRQTHVPFAQARCLLGRQAAGCRKKNEVWVTSARRSGLTRVTGHQLQWK